MVFHDIPLGMDFSISFGCDDSSSLITGLTAEYHSSMHGTTIAAYQNGHQFEYHSSMHGTTIAAYQNGHQVTSIFLFITAPPPKSVLKEDCVILEGELVQLRM